MDLSPDTIAYIKGYTYIAIFFGFIVGMPLTFTWYALNRNKGKKHSDSNH